MEAASENNGKRKRGRPPFITAELLAARAIYAEVTPRHQNNIAYRLRALNLLKDDPEFSWIADGPGMTAGKRNSWKPGILAELGRIGDVEAVRIIAREICEKKPLTKDAERAIRQWRLRKG